MSTYEDWKSDEEIRMSPRTCMNDRDIELELLRLEAETKSKTVGELVWDLETIAIESPRDSYRKEAAGYKEGIEKKIGCDEGVYDMLVTDVQSEIIDEAVIRLAVLKYYN